MDIEEIRRHPKYQEFSAAFGKMPGVREESIILTFEMLSRFNPQLIDDLIEIGRSMAENVVSMTFLTRIPDGIWNGYGINSTHGVTLDCLYPLGFNVGRYVSTLNHYTGKNYDIFQEEIREKKIVDFELRNKGMMLMNSGTIYVLEFSEDNRIIKRDLTTYFQDGYSHDVISQKGEYYATLAQTRLN